MVALGDARRACHTFFCGKPVQNKLFGFGKRDFGARGGPRWTSSSALSRSSSRIMRPSGDSWTSIRLLCRSKIVSPASAVCGTIGVGLSCARASPRMPPSRRKISDALLARFSGHVLAGRYQFAKYLASGSYAHVFKAYDQVKNDFVAVKVSCAPGDRPTNIATANLENPVDRLFVEADYTKRLGGIYGIAQYRDLVYDAESRHMCLVLRLLSRGSATVWQHVEEGAPGALGPADAEEDKPDVRARPLPRNSHGGLAVELALRIAIRVAGCLAAAHERGIVHRDCHNQNIMIEPGWTELAELPKDKDLTPLDLSLLPMTVFVIDWGGAKDYKAKRFENTLKPLATPMVSRPGVKHLPGEANEGIHYSHDVYSVALDLIQMISGCLKAFTERDDLEQAIQGLPLSEYLKNLLAQVLIQEYRHFGPDGPFKPQDRTTMLEFQARLREGLHDRVKSYYLEPIRRERADVLEKAESLEQQLATLLADQHHRENELRFFTQRYEGSLESAKSERDQALSQLKVADEALRRLKRELDAIRSRPPATPSPPPSDAALKSLQQENADLELRAAAGRLAADNYKAKVARLEANLSQLQNDLQRSDEARQWAVNQKNSAEATIRKRDAELLQVRDELAASLRRAQSLHGTAVELEQRLGESAQRLHQARLRMWLGGLGVLALLCVSLGVYTFVRLEKHRSVIRTALRTKPVPAPPAPSRPIDPPIGKRPQTLPPPAPSSPRPGEQPEPPKPQGEHLPPKPTTPDSGAEPSTVDTDAAPANATVNSAGCRIEIAQETKLVKPRHHFKGIAVLESGAILLAASSAAGTETGNGLLWLSQDGGASWQRVRDSAHPGYAGLVGMGADEAVAMGTGGLLHVHVTTGNAKWLPMNAGEKPQHFSAALGNSLNELRIISGDPGGDAWRVLTVKGQPVIGKWLKDDGTPEKPGFGNSLYALAQDDSGLSVVGYAGQISSMKTDARPPEERVWRNWHDRGRANRAVAAGSHEMLRAALRAGGQSVFCGTVAAGRGVVYHVAGPVKNWIRHDLDFPCYAVASFDETSYLLAGKKLVLEDKKTHRLTEVPTPCDFSKQPIHALLVISPQQVYVVGDDGLFYKWEK